MGTIKNLTRKAMLVAESRVFGSAWQKALGTMFLLRAPAYSIIFTFARPQRIPIHMLFVFFSLDIVWLDGEKRVLAFETMKPWSFANPPVEASFVLELPAGVIAQSKTQIGDTISF